LYPRKLLKLLLVAVEVVLQLPGGYLDQMAKILNLGQKSLKVAAAVAAEVEVDELAVRVAALVDALQARLVEPELRDREIMVEVALRSISVQLAAVVAQDQQDQQDQLALD
jgi:hypothetical protein